LGIDWGENKVGLALAHAAAKLPSPLGIIKSHGASARIKDLITEEDIELVVVGLPKSLEGEETKQSEKIREFADELQKLTDKQVVFADETLSSVRAEKYIRDNKPKDGDIDSIAACFILEELLNEQRS
jgi:putative Holliday junction resolvase